VGTEEIYRFFADLNSSQIGFNIEEMETHNVSSSLNDSESQRAISSCLWKQFLGCRKLAGAECEFESSTTL
jgi:hypothetical protein